MSPANLSYLLRNNPELDSSKIEVFPNCLDPLDLRVDAQTRIAIREKYQIPKNKIVLIYGGNLGRPQGIPFIIDSIRQSANVSDVFFLIVGGGTEYYKLESFVDIEKPNNVKLMNKLPKEEYDLLVAACDVGLIYLDHRFQIPNFPSRLLSYLQAGLPVLCATDPNTDVGIIVEENGFGWWCESDDVNTFVQIVSQINKSKAEEMGKIGMTYLLENYNINVGYEKLLDFI